VVRRTRHPPGPDQGLPELFTAQAFITTDLDDNQITAFHPGAMMRSHENHVRDVEGATFGIVAPDGRDAMLQHATEFAEPAFPSSSIRARRCRCSTATSCALHRTGRLRHRQRLRIQPAAGTHRLEREATSSSGEGLHHHARPAGRAIHTPEKTFDIPPAHERRVTDPTGCGDAFRAGLIFGIEKGYDWLTIGRMAT
jgi:adenosine kinase